MLKNRVLEDLLQENQDKPIETRYSPTTVIVSVLTFLLGVLCLYLFWLFRVKHLEQAPHYFGLVILGIIFILGGIGGFIWGPKNYYHKALHERLHCYSLYFKSGTEKVIMDALYTMNLDMFDNLQESSEMGIRLDLVATADLKYVRYRLYQLINYSSQPLSEILSLDEDTAHYILNKY